MKKWVDHEESDVDNLQASSSMTNSQAMADVDSLGEGWGRARNDVSFHTPHGCLVTGGSSGLAGRDGMILIRPSQESG